MGHGKDSGNGVTELVQSLQCHPIVGNPLIDRQYGQLGLQGGYARERGAGSYITTFEQDPYRAHFSGMAASSLNFDVVYWVETADFVRYMDIQQEIYLQIMDRFAAEGIEFAFPTQTLHLHDARGAEAAPSTHTMP